MEYADPDGMRRHVRNAHDSRRLLELVERIREEASRRPLVPCAACNASVDEQLAATACFACGELIHLDCAEDHLLTCEAPLAIGRPLLVARPA